MNQLPEVLSRCFRLFFAGSGLRTMVVCFYLLLQSLSSAAQPSTQPYDSIAAVLSNELLCCPLQINLGDQQFTSLHLGANGQIQLEADNGAKAEANLFLLYKNHQAPAGFYRKEKAIIFQLEENKELVLRTDTSRINRIDAQLGEVFQAGKNTYRSQLKLNLQQTVDSINFLLQKWTYYKPSFEIDSQGKVRLHHGAKQFFHFNLNNLTGSRYRGNEIRGIQIKFYRPGEHVQNNWINFKEKGDTKAFIKFGDLPDGVLNHLQQLFVHASTLTEATTASATD